MTHPAKAPTAAVETLLRLGRSAARLSWTGAFFGANQLFALARAPQDSITPFERASDGFDAVARAARRRMDLLPQLVFQAGDDFQSQWLDLVPEDLSPASWQRFTQRLAAAAVAPLAILRPDVEGTAARRELLDKLEVYVLVRRASASLGPVADSRERFEEAVERALALGDRQGMWMLEGLGHGYAQAALARQPWPTDLLAAARLPERAKMMVHLGLGMALAEHLFTDLEPDDEDSMELTLYRFAVLCRSHSQPGHEEAARESLGLVLRCFFPDLVPMADRVLSRRDDDEGRRVRDFFWHGVGRAVYFLPLHLLPGYGNIETALRLVEQEAPAGAALDSGRAGVAYAATLVNLGRPEVLERFVHRRPEAVDRAFVEGVVSAAVLRRRTTPDAPELDVFLAHRPSGDPARWQKLILDPVRAALYQGARGHGAVVRKLTEESP